MAYFHAFINTLDGWLATDPDGDAVSWTISSGTPPTGTTLSTSGTFSGTATAPGTFSFDATTTDGKGGTSSRSFSIFVSVPPIVASGGTIIDAGGYRHHVFTASGTLSVSSAPTGATASYLVVAGGGGGGADCSSIGGYAQGGGAGGLIAWQSAGIAAGNLSVVGGGGEGGQGVSVAAGNGTA
jgi:hypothetical protein